MSIYDFEEVAIKKAKYDDDLTKENDFSKEDDEHCIICFGRFTTSGDHKLVSIKCGHVFGQKCIEKWLSSDFVCPTCKRASTKKHIRPLFLNFKTVQLEDNEENVKTKEELVKTKEELNRKKEECSQLNLNNKLMSLEVAALKEENERLQTIQNLCANPYDKVSETSLPQSNRIHFLLTQKQEISAVGGCRVIGYSSMENRICVSCPSSVRLVSGYGVRVVDPCIGKIRRYINLHTKMIRNIAFNPFNSTPLMMTCSLDATVRLCNIATDSVVNTFKCAQPVWSCAWSNNNNILYAGLANGIINELDVRNNSAPVRTIYTQSGGPILSMRYLCANDYIKANGLLVSNGQGVIFLSSSQSDNSSEMTLAECNADTLLLSSKYGSALVDTAVNDQTFHLFNTFRPNNTNPKVRHLLSTFGSRSSDYDPMYAQDVKVVVGGASMNFMSRTCFLTNNNSVNLVVGGNEDMAAINVWDLNSNFKALTLFPRDVSREKPVLDICQINSNKLAFAAINCDNLYLFNQT